MAELNTKDRERLRSTQFAYVDSKGGEHLPIHDESHVRNAIARFNQTEFESKAAKERARRKILNAAERHGIEVDEDSRRSTPPHPPIARRSRRPAIRPASARTTATASPPSRKPAARPDLPATPSRPRDVAARRSRSLRGPAYTLRSAQGRWRRRRASASSPRRARDEPTPHDGHRVGEPAALSDDGLRHSSDTEPGIARRRCGRGFRYLGPGGAPIRDAATLARIRALAIPPAWRDVWICRDARGHLQAVGRDARGRKQPHYHATWRRQRDELKFGRMGAFGRALPRIRRRVERDLARPGLSKDKILAMVVRLLEATAIRIGNDAYARTNRSFGLTTLRNRHVTVTGTALRFRYRGKGGKVHTVGVQDRRLARIVARCEALPGQELFQYLDEDGAPRSIESADVNEYLQRAAGIAITAKDFRTWTGTLIAFRELRCRPRSPAVEERPRNAVRHSTETVAEALGNTPAVSRQSYIAPVVVEAYLAGSLPPGRKVRHDPGALAAGGFGRREELALVHFLERAGVAGDVE